ncbi:MAG: acyl-CoA/acyl-ACP dehydrogenase [Acidimicrobiia bacterium]|jgi:alkylation response protein AidB-like acyl-CoA dehydrogenase|nr:acyl-CoA/acyl-ACP dehydrogenase [Acidimicrobiia bacterium]MBP8180334.1 acyl-CoA/acyl-ACP dehydrogenase [Acidimicrobiia bacterium]
MNLDFSEEQLMLGDMVRSLLEASSPVTAVRELEDDPVGFDRQLWQQFAEADLIGLLIPESFGGSGQSLLEGIVLYQELGRALTPLPHLESAVLAAGAIASAGSSAQCEEWLPSLADGSSIMIPAWLEPKGGFGEKGVQLQAVQGGDTVTLTGIKRHVRFAAAADQFLVLARTPNGVDLFVVPANAPGISSTQYFSIASDTQYDVTFDGVEVPLSARVGSAGSGWVTWSDVMHQAIVLLAAQATGGAEKTLEITVDYSKDRFQFDKPLGSFQSLSHYMADSKTRIDGAKTLVQEAAWTASVGRSIATLAPMAKLFSCKEYRDVTAMAQQIWGGVGFTLEYDVQLYFRRAKQLQISWWDDRYLEELIAVQVLDNWDGALA